MLTDDILTRLQALSDACPPTNWTSIVEGRDQLSGSSFILQGVDGEDLDDIYVTLEAIPAPESVQDLIAAARTYLPELIQEVRDLRKLMND